MITWELAARSPKVAGSKPARAAPPDENAAVETGLDEETERQLLEGF